MPSGHPADDAGARRAGPTSALYGEGRGFDGRDDPVASAEEVEYSENQIAVHWREEEYYQPPEEFKAQANANDESILERFSPENFPECFTEYADLLTWDKKWDTMLDSSNPPFFKWFVGGRLNACVNCVDRHLESRGDKNAIIWVPEPEDVEPVEITYRELHRRVNEFAALLKDFVGAKPQDRITFHLPMVPELPVVDARVRPARA